jgi:GntR family transcriptional regulator
LRIPLNSPVGEVRRVLQDQNGVVIYLGEAIYRGDMVKLERVLTK